MRLLPIQVRLRQGAPDLQAFSDTVFMAAQYASHFNPDAVNISLGDLAVLENQFVTGSVTGPAPPACEPVVVVPKNKASTFNALRDKLSAEISEIQTTFNVSNTLVVIAAGNCALDLDETDYIMEYPGSMRGPNVLVVGSVGVSGHPNADQQSSFTNWGSGHVDVAAPGEFFVESLVLGSGQNLHYAGSNADFPACEPFGIPPPGDAGCHGTSYAAPMVAGAAALMIAADPSLEHKPCQIAQRILHSADSFANLSNVGGRRLNVKTAVHDTSTSLLCP